MKSNKDIEYPATNEGRAERAADALALYTDEEGLDALNILVTDLRHLCDRDNLNWFVLLEMTRHQYSDDLQDARIARRQALPPETQARLESYERRLAAGRKIRELNEKGATPAANDVQAPALPAVPEGDPHGGS